MAAPAATADRSFLLPRCVLFLETPNYVAPSLPMLPVRLEPSEIRAFDCFRTKIIHLLSIHFSASVWKDVILRRSHEDPTTLHGLVAIGAMFQVRYGAADQQQTLAPSTASSHSDEDIALRHYMKALAGLRTSIANSNTRDRIGITQSAMIACLLFVTFEMLKGDQTQAISHMIKGLAILSEHSRPSPASQSSKPVRRRAPSPTLDKIGSMFARLDAECALSGPWTPFLQRLDDDLDIDDTPSIPTLFHTIADAKGCLDVLNTRALAFRNTLLRMAVPEHEQLSIGAPQCLRHFCTLNTRARRLPPDTLAQLRSKRARLLSVYDCWVEALVPLKQGLSLPTAVLMEVQAFFSWFILSSSLDASELSCDVYSDRFEHLLDLTQQYARGANRKAGSYGFALDSGILVSLYLMGIKCRDSVLRKKAKALLRQAKVQEGLWNGGVLAAVVERMGTLEEERARALEEGLGKALPQDGDLTAEQIPEKARFSDVAFVVESHLIRIVCSRFVDDTSEEMEVIEEVIPSP